MQRARIFGLWVAFLAPAPQILGHNLCPERFVIEAGGRLWEIPYCTSHPLDAANPVIRRLVVVVQGALRNADLYFDYALTAARAANRADLVTAIVAPQFTIAADVSEHMLGPDALVWSFDGWPHGQDSLTSGVHISSFAVLDLLLEQASRKDLFPNLEEVVIAGHSFGGNFVQRFAASSAVETVLSEERGLRVKYVAANPDSYLYLDEARADAGGGFSIPGDAVRAGCPGFNAYRYGLEGLIPYLAGAQLENIRRRYFERSVVYLLGSDDTNVDDFTCAAALQGAHNFQRGRIYHEYLQHYYGPVVTNTHTLAIVQGVGHDPSAIFNSEAGIQHLFPSDPARCPPRAVLTVTPASGEFPLNVTLHAVGSSTPEGTEITAYTWDFGDGVQAAGPASSHVYTAPGKFVVTLTLTSDAGCGAVANEIVTVRCPAGMLDPWRSSDLGSPPFPGSAMKEDQEGSLCAWVCVGGRFLGSGLASSDDQAFFIYREAACDTVVTAEIAGGSSGTSTSQVGLMLREGLEPSARQVSLVLETTTVSSVFRLLARPEAGGRLDTVATAPSPLSRGFIQLQSLGGDFVAKASQDGVAWTEVGRVALELSDTLLAGALATGGTAASGVGFVPIQARICELEIQACGPREPVFIRGDANEDAHLDLSDAVSVLVYLFSGAPEPSCEESADANDSGEVDVSDAVFACSFLFLGGSGPSEPFPSCGLDSTADGLTCEDFGACAEGMDQGDGG